jgi:N-acetylglutamate synthase-like GNAT family acetyltransferase
MSKHNAIVIHSFKPELAQHFKLINQQWIEAMFVMEDIDLQVLSDPQNHIIAPGGHIWFAEHHDLGIVGTGALYKKAPGIFELTKMGVLENARGLKVGELLLKHILTEAQHIAYQSLFLLTNSKCAAAIHLYEKNGFSHDQKIMQDYGKLYQRCNVAMRYTAIKT